MTITGRSPHGECGLKNEYGHLQLYMTRTPSRNKSIVAECGEKYGKTGAEQIQR